MSKLPDKPSALIRVALHDLKLCEKDPKYRINMMQWVTPNMNTCSVCLAGSVMVKTLGVSPTRQTSPAYVVAAADPDQGKLQALDWFRRSQVRIGLSTMRISTPSKQDWSLVSIPEYRKDPKGFKLAMYELAADLERAGL